MTKSPNLAARSGTEVQETQAESSSIWQMVLRSRPCRPALSGGE